MSAADTKRIKNNKLVLFFCVCFLMLDYTRSETENIFLNSHQNCDNIVYEVSPDLDYFIRPDVTSDAKTRSFRDCEVSFSSYKEDGHLCLLQTGNVGRILDPNAQLEARDGLGDSTDHVIEVLKTYPSTWRRREYCSQNTQYITLFLKEIKKQNGADIDKVQIQFRMVDIESEKRVLYLDGNYCNMKYPLLNSRVTVENRPHFPGMAVSTLTEECGIRFDRIGGSRNTSICFAYIPSENVDCNDDNWRFAVSVADFSFNEKYIKYSLKCNDSRAREIHVWCAEPDVSFVTVIQWRSENILSNSSFEPPKMFQYLVRDYKGTEESFFEEMKAMFETNSAGFPSQWIIYILAGVGGLFVALVIGIWCKRRTRYKPVENGETSRAV